MNDLQDATKTGDAATTKTRLSQLNEWMNEKI